jgi:hypothetical protein
MGIILPLSGCLQTLSEEIKTPIDSCPIAYPAGQNVHFTMNTVNADSLFMVDSLLIGGTLPKPLWNRWNTA